jgi:glyoxylate reductase
MRELLPEEEELVKPLANYKMFTGENITNEIVARETEHVDAISSKIPSRFFLSKDTLRNAKNLKVINVSTNTFDIGTFINHGLDIKTATEMGIYVTNTPVGSRGIADKTWGLLLAAARKVIECDRYTRSGKWKESNTHHIRFLVQPVHDRTIGIIGLGMIGKEVVKRAKGFNMRILYHDIKRNEKAEKELGVEYVDLSTLLKESDFVSIHTGPVFHLIGEEELNLMKNNAILINTARGECVDTKALYKSLRDNKIAAAGLDVFEKEPIEPENPLLTLPNIVLSPHSGSPVERYIKMTRIAMQNIINVVNGKMPLYLVNKEVAEIRPLKRE